MSSACICAVEVQDRWDPTSPSRAFPGLSDEPLVGDTTAWGRAAQSGHLRKRPPAGHLSPANSRQASDSKGSPFFETRLQWGKRPGRQRDHSRNLPSASFF